MFTWEPVPALPTSTIVSPKWHDVFRALSWCKSVGWLSAGTEPERSTDGCVKGAERDIWTFQGGGRESLIIKEYENGEVWTRNTHSSPEHNGTDLISGKKLFLEKKILKSLLCIVKFPPWTLLGGPNIGRINKGFNFQTFFFIYINLCCIILFFYFHNLFLWCRSVSKINVCELCFFLEGGDKITCYEWHPIKLGWF